MSKTGNPRCSVWGETTHIQKSRLFRCFCPISEAGWTSRKKKSTTCNPAKTNETEPRPAMFEFAPTGSQAKFSTGGALRVSFCFHLGPALLRPNFTRNSALGPRHAPSHAPHLRVTLAEPRRPAACAPRPRQIWHWRVARQEQRSSPQERRPKTVSYQLMLLSLGLEQVVRHHQRARRGDKKVRKSSDPAARRNLLMKLLSH